MSKEEFRKAMHELLDKKIDDLYEQGTELTPDLVFHKMSSLPREASIYFMKQKD